MSWQQPPPPPGGPPGPPHGWGGQNTPPQGGGWGAPPQGPQPGFGPPQSPSAVRQASDRSALILVLSLSSLMALFIGCTACGPLALVSLGMSIPAIVMARRDLQAINEGRMVATGRDATNVGMIIAIVSTVFSVLIGAFMILLMIFYGGLFGAAIIAAALENA